MYRQWHIRTICATESSYNLQSFLQQQKLVANHTALDLHNAQYTQTNAHHMTPSSERCVASWRLISVPERISVLFKFSVHTSQLDANEYDIRTVHSGLRRWYHLRHLIGWCQLMRLRHRNNQPHLSPLNTPALWPSSMYYSTINWSFHPED